jgi:hypothetical protein
VPVCSYAGWLGVADARASLSRRRRVVPGRKTHSRIRLGTPGREVGGGAGPDHGTSGNLRNSLESGIPPPPLRRSGVHGRNGPQRRTRRWGSRRNLSRVLDLWHRRFCSSSLREKAVALGRRRYGESEEEETERRSIGPCQRSRGLEGSHPVSTSRDSWITVRLGVPQVRRVVDWVGSLGNGYQLCRSGTRGGIV